jgi:arsenate reductase (thioredoxin)
MDNNFCPTLLIPRLIDWGIEDPKDKPIERVREIRNETERRFQELATSVVTNEDNSR